MTEFAEAMPIETGTFNELSGESDSTTSQLHAAIARSAENLTSGQGWPDGVHDLLGALGRITGVSRVWIFQIMELQDNYIVQDYTFEWAADGHAQLGMKMFSMFRTEIDQPEYRNFIESRKRGEWQKILVDDLKPCYIRENLEKQNIKSMLTIPIMVDGKWWGTLGFDDCERSYRWTDLEISLLRTAAFLISSAIIQDRLAAKRKQFDIMHRLTESGAWEYDIKQGIIWCTADIVRSVPGKTDSYTLSIRQTLQLVHHADRRMLVKSMRRFLESSEDTFRQDVRLLSDCGEFKWVEIIGKLSRDMAGRPEQLAGIVVDIITRKEQEQKLLEEATHDPLTGACNRTQFDMELEKLFRTYHDEGQLFSLLMLDLDFFKSINDTWGHEAGDEALCRTVDLCQSLLDETQIFARIGGEEFAILLPDTDEFSARFLAERIRKKISENAIAIPQGVIKITASFGVHTPTARDMSAACIKRQADNALYAAKRQGRNIVCSSLESAACKAC